MTIAQSLLPWLVYAVVGVAMREQLAATMAALVALGVVGRALLVGRHRHELAIEISSAIFFVGYACIAWVTEGSPNITRWMTPTSQFWLAATVGYGLLRRRPFTLPIASREVPEAIHRTPQFLGLNMAITSAWFASFTGSGVILAAALIAHRSSTWLNITCIVVAITAPTIYTKRLVARSRAARTRGAAR